MNNVKTNNNKLIKYIQTPNTNGPISPATIILDGTNITAQNPDFVNETDYELKQTSPAINAGDPSFGLHPVSLNTYDIGSYEYHGFVYKTINATLANIDGRTLTYEWSFVEEPTNGSNTPDFSNTSGNIETSNASTDFWIRKLGLYKVKLVIKEAGTEVTSGIVNLNVGN